MATVLVDELVRLGITDVVLAPGSRSAPLAYAVASLTFRDSVNTYSRLVLAALTPLLLLAGAALPGALTLIRAARPSRTSTRPSSKRTTRRCR